MSEPKAMKTECCHVDLAPDQRYCTKCGWEARVMTEPKDSQAVAWRYRVRDTDPWALTQSEPWAETPIVEALVPASELAEAEEIIERKHQMIVSYTAELSALRAELEQERHAADDANLSRIAAEEERELLRENLTKCRNATVQNALQITALQEELMKSGAELEQERMRWEAIGQAKVRAEDECGRLRRELEQDRKDARFEKANYSALSKAYGERMEELDWLLAELRNYEDIAGNGGPNMAMSLLVDFAKRFPK